MKNTRRSARTLTWIALLLGAAAPAIAAQQEEEQREALKINDSIYMAIGSSNSYLVNTPAGSVVIDTSNPQSAAKHLELLRAVSKAPVKYIILTHAHWDHTGGVALWKQAGTHVIAQRNQVDFLNYQKRLNNFYSFRDTTQFGHAYPTDAQWAGNFGAKPLADILFDDKYEFTLGGLKFEIYSTPGETPDQLTVWIPQLKAAFIGDNYNPKSFPAIYTLRGTRPRWALDWVGSLKRDLDLKPEVLLLGHGMPLRGNAEIAKQLTKHCDAILYVHDAVVKGMNDGKDVFTLMKEIHLPRDLDVGETFGKVSFSVRGIYDAYAGWFDVNPSTMFETPVSAVYGDVVKLAGGPDAITKLALERIQNGKLVEALHLTDIALASDPSNRGALEARLKALEKLLDASQNYMEANWLDYGVRDAKQKLGIKEQRPQ
jgi:alkyl sulfatase BDS1-like metallo-beta-lactamase superfamily hydrolase